MKIGWQAKESGHLWNTKKYVLWVNFCMQLLLLNRYKKTRRTIVKFRKFLIQGCILSFCPNFIRVPRNFTFRLPGDARDSWPRNSAKMWACRIPGYRTLFNLFFLRMFRRKKIYSNFFKKSYGFRRKVVFWKISYIFLFLKWMKSSENG